MTTKALQVTIYTTEDKWFLSCMCFGFCFENLLRETEEKEREQLSSVFSLSLFQLLNETPSVTLILRPFFTRSYTHTHRDNKPSINSALNLNHNKHNCSSASASLLLCFSVSLFLLQLQCFSLFLSLPLSMSSDLFVCEGSFYHQPTRPEMDSNDEDLHFFSHPFSPFTDSPIDNLLNEISEPSNQQTPVSLSSSPPSTQLQNLTLHQNTPNLPILGNGLISGLTSLDDVLDVKAEESQGSLEFCYNQNNFFPHSYSGAENVSKYMQRSYSSNTFDVSTSRPGICFKPQLNSLMEMMESPNFQNQSIGSPEDSFFAGQMRRVFSTGDLQVT